MSTRVLQTKKKTMYLLYQIPRYRQNHYFNGNFHKQIIRLPLYYLKIWLGEQTNSIQLLSKTLHGLGKFLPGVRMGGWSTRGSSPRFAPPINTTLNKTIMIMVILLIGCCPGFPCTLVKECSKLDKIHIPLPSGLTK